jgi:hypothetical protein
MLIGLIPNHINTTMTGMKCRIVTKKPKFGRAQSRMNAVPSNE